MNTRVSRFARAATSAVLAGLLAAPTSALAVSRLHVDDVSYTEASSDTGWTWDGSENLELNDFNGTSIWGGGEGGLVVTLVGDNTVETIGVAYGLSAGHDESLTITGDGTLTTEHIYNNNYAGDINIEGTTINIEHLGDETRPHELFAGLAGNASVNISDSTVSIDFPRELTEGDDDAFSWGIIAPSTTISNSIVDIVADGPMNYAWQDSYGNEIISIDTSHVHAISNLTEADASKFGYVDSAVRAFDSIILSGVEGDIIIEDSDVGVRLNGEDGNVWDILLDPIPEDVSEEKTVTRTIRYVFEDGSEASAPLSDALTLTRTGGKNPLTGEITWEEWSTATFADVNSPVIEGYTATLVVVAGELVDGDSSDLEYEVVYVKDAEPEPAPEPAKAVIPQAGDAAAAAQTVQGVAAGIGTLLSAAGIALKRRKD